MELHQGWIADALDSNAINDCGLYLNAVGMGTRYEGTFAGSSTAAGKCSTWNDWDKWDQTTKDNLKQFMMSSMDALQVSTLFPDLFPSSRPARRTISSGPGRLVTPLPQAKSKLPSGRTSLLWNKAGHQQTLVTLMDSASALELRLTNSPGHFSHGKSVAMVRMSSPPSTITSGL